MDKRKFPTPSYNIGHYVIGVDQVSHQTVTGIVSKIAYRNDNIVYELADNKHCCIPEKNVIDAYAIPADGNAPMRAYNALLDDTRDKVLCLLARYGEYISTEGEPEVTYEGDDIRWVVKTTENMKREIKLLKPFFSYIGEKKVKATKVYINEKCNGKKNPNPEIYCANDEGESVVFPSFSLIELYAYLVEAITKANNPRL